MHRNSASMRGALSRSQATVKVGSRWRSGRIEAGQKTPGLDAKGRSREGVDLLRRGMNRGRRRCSSGCTYAAGLYWAGFFAALS